MTPQQLKDRPINKLHKGSKIVLKNGEKHIVERVEGAIFFEKIVLECGRKINEEEFYGRF